MPRFAARLLCAACLLLTLPAARGEPPPRTDLYGDPLPQGAIARLGTVRFRHPSQVKHVAVSPDGKTLASSCGYDTVYLWEAATGKPLRELKLPKQHSADSLAFSPDGGFLAVGHDGVSLWRVATGEQLFRGEDGQCGVRRSLAFSPDGKALACAPYGCGGNGGWQASVITLWEVPGGRELLRLRGHEKGIAGFAFSPDGRALASVGEDRTLRLWDPATGQEVRRLVDGQAQPTQVAFSPDGSRLAWGNWEGVVTVLDLAAGGEVWHVAGHRQSVEVLSFSPDGTALLSGQYYGTARLWDATTGHELPGSDAVGLLGSSGAFSPDGKTLVLWGNGQAIHLWDVAAGRESRPAEGHTDQVVSVSVSPAARPPECLPRRPAGGRHRDGRAAGVGGRDRGGVRAAGLPEPREGPPGVLPGRNIAALPGRDARARVPGGPVPGGVGHRPTPLAGPRAGQVPRRGGVLPGREPGRRRRRGGGFVRVGRGHRRGVAGPAGAPRRG
jgi:WD40 repeat protein